LAKETTVRAIAYNPSLYQKPAKFTTPHVPAVHSKTGGVANAVVYLKHVEPSKSKPWDHANVHIEFDERQLRIQQGDAQTNVGFVKRGSNVEVVNRDADFHLLRARGSAFFAMPLVEANKVHRRVLDKTGLVDLTCAAGYYWLQAHLFVAEHPYYARTDAEGRFKLDRVPAGTYEVICWLPSWHVEREERDPETADVARWIWAAPKEQTQTVRVQVAKTSEMIYRWNLTMKTTDGHR
jgi:hypothetical protein